MNTSQGGSMNIFQSGVIPLSLIFKGGGRGYTIIFGFQKGVTLKMGYFYSILTKCFRGSDPLDPPMSQ
jgi:hypothetical protein